MMENEISRIAEIFRTKLEILPYAAPFDRMVHLGAEAACDIILAAYLDELGYEKNATIGFVKNNVLTFGAMNGLVNTNNAREIAEELIAERIPRARSMIEDKALTEATEKLHVAAIVFEVVGGLINSGAQFPPMDGGDLSTYSAIYAAYKIQLQQEEKRVNEAKTLIQTEVDREIKERFDAALDEKIDTREQEFIQIFEKRAKGVAEETIANARTDIEMGATQIIDDLKVTAEAMLENKKSELVETIIIDDAMKLWNKKAWRHRIYFLLGATLFIGLICVPLLYLFDNFFNLATQVKEIIPEDQTIPWGSLLVFTFPILGYAWILRFISRFTLHNLTLTDDASQRSVMAKTFIRLVGQGGVNGDKDRAIMLNALFRPMPGVNEHDMQPPSIADFVSRKN